MKQWLSSQLERCYEGEGSIQRFAHFLCDRSYAEFAAYYDDATACAFQIDT